jgi:hypothetical protein
MEVEHTAAALPLASAARVQGWTEPAAVAGSDATTLGSIFERYTLLAQILQGK